MDLLTELESLIPELQKGLDQASSLQDMEALRVDFLGRRGRLARIMAHLPEAEPAARRDSVDGVSCGDGVDGAHQSVDEVALYGERCRKVHTRSAVHEHVPLRHGLHSLPCHRCHQAHPGDRAQPGARAVGADCVLRRLRGGSVHQQ